MCECFFLFLLSYRPESLPTSYCFNGYYHSPSTMFLVPFFTHLCKINARSMPCLGLGRLHRNAYFTRHCCCFYILPHVHPIGILLIRLPLPSTSYMIHNFHVSTVCSFVPHLQSSFLPFLTTFPYDWVYNILLVRLWAKRIQTTSFLYCERKGPTNKCVCVPMFTTVLVLLFRAHPAQFRNILSSFCLSPKRSTYQEG